MKEKIKTLRIAAGFTQERLAHMCGYKYQSTVGMWESGERTPPTDKLLVLAKALGCTVDELLSGTEERNDTRESA